MSHTPADAEVSSEVGSDDGRRTGTASVRIKTERLQGNDGKLNALDLVWDRVKGVLRSTL